MYVVEEVLRLLDLNYDVYSLDREVREKLKKNNNIAISKLEELRNFIYECTYIKDPDYTNVCNYIDQQIKELKEKRI